MRYPTVFQPCRIGGLILKNRLAMSQMTMNFATEGGHVTDKLIAHYASGRRGGRPDLRRGTYFTPRAKGTSGSSASLPTGTSKGSNGSPRPSMH